MIDANEIMQPKASFLFFFFKVSPYLIGPNTLNIFVELQKWDTLPQLATDPLCCPYHETPQTGFQVEKFNILLVKLTTEVYSSKLKCYDDVDLTA